MSCSDWSELLMVELKINNCKFRNVFLYVELIYNISYKWEICRNLTFFLEVII